MCGDLYFTLVKTDIINFDSLLTIFEVSNEFCSGWGSSEIKHINIIVAMRPSLFAVLESVERKKTPYFPFLSSV